MTDRQAGVEEVPPGYKRTDVGVIPEEWSVEQLLNVLHLPTGQVNPCREPYRSMILVAPDHIESATGRLLVKETAAEQRAISGKYLFKAGDIVYSKIRPYLRKVILADFDGLCSADMYPLTTNRAASPGFMLAVLLGHKFSTFAEAVSARSGIPKINRSELAEYRVALPPLPEQRAIAAALSDVDGLMGALDALIEKKRAIKQAAMQQLLTGKTRLPGFSSEWETKRLGDVGVFSKGRGIKRDDVSDGGVPCIRYGELYTRYYNYVTTPVSRIPMTVAQTALPIKTGDLLFAGSGETAEDIGRCAAYLGDEQAYVGGDIIVLTPSGQNSMYLGYLMNCSSVAAQKARLGQGDAVVHISATNLARVEINLPPIDEQRAIATFLSDMDTEIAALERRREKAEQIKQGMMQQLLTGRIRLVEPPEAAA